MLFNRAFFIALAMVFTSPVFAEDFNQSNPAVNQEPDSQIQQIIKININHASAKELTNVKGLNISKAKAIIAYRKKYGEFKSLDELNKVKGFKKMQPETLKDIQSRLVAE